MRDFTHVSVGPVITRVAVCSSMFGLAQKVYQKSMDLFARGTTRSGLCDVVTAYVIFHT